MRRFTSKVIDQIAATKYMPIRAGGKHRFIPVWVVVVEGRAYVRSWNDKPDGWYRAFLKDPVGAVELDEKVVEVRARPVTAGSVNDQVTEAFAEKYATTANRPYVEGFREPERVKTTLELMPA